MKSYPLTLKRILVACSIAMLPMAAQANPNADEAHSRCGAAHPTGHHGGEMGPEAGFMGELGPLPPFLHGIDLTEAQRDSIFSILHDEAPALRDRMKNVRKAHEALRALTFSDNYDEAKAKELAETLADNTAVLSLLRARGESRIYALLTPEQRKQAGEARDRFGPHPASLRRFRMQGGRHAL